MKLPRNTLLWCVLIVCLTLLIFTDTEIALRNPVQGHGQEVAAFMAYESAK
jgi:protein HokB